MVYMQESCIIDNFRSKQTRTWIPVYYVKFTILIYNFGDLKVFSTAWTPVTEPQKLIN